VKKACELTGKSRATVYRRRGGIRSGCRERRPAAANALSAGERDELLAVLDSPRFQDKAPRQVWALLIDEGVYRLRCAGAHATVAGVGVKPLYHLICIAVPRREGDAERTPNRRSGAALGLFVACWPRRPGG